MTEDTVQWFLQERGIRPETLDHFGVKIDGITVTLPYANGEKTRRIHPDGKREFYFTSGRKPSLFNLSDVNKNTVFIVEGETDTMRLWQTIQDAGKGDEIGVVGLSGIHTWQREFADAFKGRVLVVLDNDADYMVQAQVDKTYLAIKQALGPKARRIKLPADTKDLCEFFDRYDLQYLSMLAKRGHGVSRWKPLDLTQAPPPPNWLLDGLVSRGDVTLLAGPSGIGKSWFTMGLCVATAEGWPEFLNAKMQASGPVLYIDQENPSDVIYNRLKRLGLTRTSNLRYLWNENIRLDRNPADLIDEAIDFQPKLVVLDSLTRIHAQDENNAQAMANLFNEGIQPLARETGAAVLLIHHNNKSGQPRGSVDIEASVDNVLHMLPLDIPGTFKMKQGKSRRRLGGEEFNVQIKDVGTGVQLVYEPPLEVPF